MEGSGQCHVPLALPRVHCVWNVMAHAQKPEGLEPKYHSIQFNTSIFLDCSDPQYNVSKLLRNVRKFYKLTLGHITEDLNVKLLINCARFPIRLHLDIAWQVPHSSVILQCFTISTSRVPVINGIIFETVVTLKTGRCQQTTHYTEQLESDCWSIMLNGYTS